MIDAAQATRMVGGRDVGSIREDDFYPTPAEAVWRLLAVEKFVGPVWEPACGDGSISEVLREHGHVVISSDLVDRGYGEPRCDFLMERSRGVPNVITNPPFKLAQEFADHALHVTTGKVALLMRLVWLEGVKRRKFFEATPLARVWVFSKRIPRMHRGGYEGKKSSSSIAFAWFVWEHGREGKPTLGWI